MNETERTANFPDLQRETPQRATPPDFTEEELELLYKLIRLQHQLKEQHNVDIREPAYQSWINDCLDALDNPEA